MLCPIWDFRPCNTPCAEDYWHRYDGGVAATQGPICGVEGCTAAPGPSPSPPGPPAPLPHFKPVNRTNCTYLEGRGFDARVPDHPAGIGHVHSREDCCRACFEDMYCVVGAWREDPDNTTTPALHHHNTTVGAWSAGNCYLHYSMASERARSGVVGCVTGRA